MAIYPSSFYGRGKSRNLMWVYIVLSLLIIGLVIIFLYSYPLGAGRGKPAQDVPTDLRKTAEPERKVGKPRQQPVAPSAAKPVTRPPVEAAANEPNKVVPDPDAKLAELIAQAVACVNDKPPRIIEARDRLNELLPMPLSAQQRATVKRQLSELSDKWLFSRTIFPQDKLCGSYEVKPGDLFTTIGRQFKVPYEILMQINNFSRPEALQAGQTIKVINGPFHARVSCSAFTLDLYLQNTFVRSFTVGLGKPGMETPTGLWLVKEDGKLIRPIWTDPVTGKTYKPESPDYPLGSRWIGLEGLEGSAKGRTGFAIHGTNDPNQIGAAGSQGCIRLHNGDAVLMYNLLTPGNSRVEVVE
jgi:LysM repeat protein